MELGSPAGKEPGESDCERTSVHFTSYYYFDLAEAGADD
jgi:hypothetical protein